MSSANDCVCSKERDDSWGELTDLIHPSLTQLDYTKPMTKVKVVLTTTILSFFITYLMHLFFKATSSVYRGLKLKHQIFWDTSVIRGLFGAFCIIFSTWAIFGNTRLEEDIVWATTPTSHLAVCVTVGFFLFENIALTFSDLYFRCFSKMLHVHHWMSFIGFCIVLVTDASHHLGTKSIMLELSTPFSALCWVLLKCGKEKTLLWKTNQFFLVHTFHIRSIIECMIWYISYRNWSYIWSDMPGPLFALLYTQLVLVTFIMTPHWTYQKTKQLIVPVDWNFEGEKLIPENSEQVIPLDDSQKTSPVEENDDASASRRDSPLNAEKRDEVANRNLTAGNENIAVNNDAGFVEAHVDVGAVILGEKKEDTVFIGDGVRERHYAAPPQHEL